MVIPEEIKKQIKHPGIGVLVQITEGVRTIWNASELKFLAQLARQQMPILAPEIALNEEIKKNTYLTIGRGEKVDSR
jgi:hypothetical protein